MRIRLFSFFLLLPFFLLQSEPGKKKNNKDVKKVLLWQGEISAVYKDKGKIRTAILSDPDWLGEDFPSLEKKLKDKSHFTVRQKITDKVIGEFILKHIELEKILEKGKKKEFHVVLLGKLQLRQKSYSKKISNDFYIAMHKTEDAYLDPSVFYKDEPTPPASSIIHPKDKKEMVLVPAGLFMHGQGTDGSGDNYNPAFQAPAHHNVMELPSFYIDKYEVTNREYDRYLEETGASPPKHWIGGEIPSGKEDHPVTSLTYREAEGYAKWSGKRLPTEFEWEKAARGSGITLIKNRDESFTFDVHTVKYPWGNKFNSSFCNSAESGKKDTVSVYELSEKGASPYGVIGLCGNAPEWTSSWYEPYEGHNFKSSVKGNAVKVIRGGSFIDSAKNCTVYFRNYGGMPNLSEDRRAGFRLVKDLN